jgi:hypothetical protein
MATVKKGPGGAEDLNFKDSGTSKQTFTRSDASGRTLTLSKIDAGHIQFRSLAKYIEDLVDGGYDVPIDVASITLSNGTTITSGTGSPESVVTAPPGSLFLRTDGSTFTTLYYKSSGTGSTGWLAANANVDTVDTYDASQSPGANEIPVLDSSAVLNLPAGQHLIGTNKILNESNSFIDETIATNGGLVTMTAGGAEILSYNLGTVTADDLIFIAFGCEGTKGATPGDNTLTFAKKSGTATLNAPTTCYDSRYVFNATTYSVNLPCVLKIATTGTLVINVTGTSAGSNTTVAIGDAFIKPFTILSNG